MKDVFKEQYALKRSIYYFFGTKVNLYWFILSILLSNSLQDFILTYPIGVLFLYRFFFKIKKEDNPYKQIFLLSKWQNFIQKLKKLDK